MASFSKAFAAARKAGKKEFTWNGKRYNTKLKSETKKKSPPTPTPRPKPTKTPTPTPRPDRSAQKARTTGGAAASIDPSKVHARFVPKDKPKAKPKEDKKVPRPTPRPDRSAEKARTSGGAAASVNPSKMHDRFKKNGLSIKERAKKKNSGSKGALQKMLGALTTGNRKKK